MKLSPCVKWIFANSHDNLGDRVRAAKAAGYDHAEFHLWRDKDMAGRNEPGTGTIDWPALVADLRALDYDGPFGLEYRPSRPALASLELTKEALDA